MPSIWIPPPLRDLTGGLGVIRVPGSTVREALENLERIHPGIWGRLCRGDDLNPAVALVVDGEESELRMHHPLEEGSEVHFVPAVSGGAEQQV